MAVKAADLSKDYKYGFSDPEQYAFKSRRGLDREIVEQISAYKHEPDWMLQFRLRALDIFFKKPMPSWGADLSQIPQPDPEQLRMLDQVEARITTAIDVGAFIEQKRTALATHASQIEESFWARVPPEAFRALFGEEAFIRAHDTTGAPLPEADLFVGLG